MNKHQNTGTYSFYESESTNSYIGFGLSKFFFSIKETLKFDVFQYSNIYNEKLQIVYANIRV